MKYEIEIELQRVQREQLQDLERSRFTAIVTPWAPKGAKNHVSDMYYKIEEAQQLVKVTLDWSKSCQSRYLIGWHWVESGG